MGICTAIIQPTDTNFYTNLQILWITIKTFLDDIPSSLPDVRYTTNGTEPTDIVGTLWDKTSPIAGVVGDARIRCCVYKTGDTLASYDITYTAISKELIFTDNVSIAGKYYYKIQIPVVPTRLENTSSSVNGTTTEDNVPELLKMSYVDTGLFQNTKYHYRIIGSESVFNITATSDGIASATDTTTITLNGVIAGLASSNIVVKRNNVALNLNTDYTLTGLSTQTILIAFLDNAHILNFDEIYLKIDKLGYLVNTNGIVTVENQMEKEITAISNGISSKTGTTTITLDHAIVGLVSGDIVVNKDSSPLTLADDYTLSDLSTTSPKVTFTAGADLVHASVVEISITKAYHTITDPITVENTIVDSTGVGYIAGNYTGGRNIQTVNFDTKATGNLSNLLPTGECLTSAGNDSNKGIVMGGYDNTNKVQGILFSDQSAFTAGTTLATAQYGNTGGNSATQAYSFGGASSGTNIQIINFASDYTAANTGTSIRSRYYATAACSTTTAFIAGGEGGVSTIDSVLFSTNAVTQETTTLVAGRGTLSNANTNDKGYFMAGRSSSEVDGIVFSSKAQINPTWTLTTGRDGSNSIHNGVDGLTAGGYSATVTIEGINMSDETHILTSVYANLPAAAAHAAGFQSGGWT